jgi:hypothetical protein
LPFRHIEGERHQARPRLHQPDAELARDPIGEIGGADFRDRKSAGGKHDTFSLYAAGTGGQHEPGIGLSNCADAARDLPAYLSKIALGFQHSDDVFG